MTEKDKIKQRKEKYTPWHYTRLKIDNGLKWAEVPFTCHQCGKTFHVSNVKPKAFPKNCSAECRHKAFDPSIGAIESTRIKSADWSLAKEMVMLGKHGPQIAEKLGMSAIIVHKNIKKRFGMEVYNRLIENGKKSRKIALLKSLRDKNNVNGYTV